MPDPIKTDPPVLDRSITDCAGRILPTPHNPPDPPIPPGLPSGCPVHIIARQTLTSARSLTRMLRSLRISITRCSTCPTRIACPLPGDFNAQLSVALQEVTDEWQLT